MIEGPSPIIKKSSNDSSHTKGSQDGLFSKDGKVGIGDDQNNISMRSPTSPGESPSIPAHFEIDTHVNDDSAPPAHASSETAGMLLIADIVGSGILGLGYSFAKLGWIIAFISGAVWLPLNIYAGLLLYEVKLHHKNAHTFADIAGAVTNNNKAVKYIVGASVYLFILTILGNYLLIMAESLQNVFALSIPESCKYSFCIVSVIFLIPIVQYRTLNATRVLLIINIFALFIAIFIAFGSLFSVGIEESLLSRNATRELVASDLTFLSFFEGQAMFAFAYSGTILYLEIMSEMRDVREFPKSLACYGGPFQLTSYLVTGSVAYVFLGNAATAMLTSMIPINGAFVASNLFLFVHIWIAFIIKTIVLSRAIHKVVSPSSVNDFSKRGKGAKIWLVITISILIFCFILANAIPMFSILSTLLGAVLAPWSGFFFPILFAIKLRRDLKKETMLPEQILMGVLFLFNGLLFLCGTYEAIQSIYESDVSGRGPFDCISIKENSQG